MIEWNATVALFSFTAWFLVQWVRRRFVSTTGKFGFGIVSTLISSIGFHTLLKLVDQSIETETSVPRWILWAVAVSSLELVAWNYFSTLHRRCNWISISFFLRVGILASIICLLCEPIKKDHHQEIQKKHVAIFLDNSLSMSLPNSRKDEKKEITSTRIEEAAKILLGEEKSESKIGGLLQTLSSDYEVRLYEFAESAREVKQADWVDVKKNWKPVQKIPGNNESNWKSSTRLSEAASQLAQILPTEDLSSVLFLTDGCDRTAIEPYVEELKEKNIPVHSILFGDQRKVKDAEVLFVQSPQQVLLGDEFSVRAMLKAENLVGRKLVVRFLENSFEQSRQVIRVTSNRFRKPLTFKKKPEKTGPYKYQIVIDPIEGEEIQDNNAGSSTTWVSKETIHILMIENRPRWEFRYLRNLFSGRDKSVYLQWLLLRPDRIEGLPDPPILEASASRAFDDCEATAFPATEKEWMKFDVIILGDVSPDDLGEDRMEILNRFVRKKGSSLIVISGKQSMPAAFSKTSMMSLFPVKLGGPAAKSVKKADIYLQINKQVQNSEVLSQSEDSEQSDKIWAELPGLTWSHPMCEAKPGATVLAYWSENRDKKLSLQQARKNALILWQRYGAGKVLQLNFDQTWRLRYGIGDRRHHRFWAQVVRWAIADRLPVGTSLVRMGLDRSAANVGESIAVRARLFDKNRNPVDPKSIKANVFLKNKLKQSVELKKSDSDPYLLHAKVSGLSEPGDYELRLVGSTVDRLLELEGRKGTKIETKFVLTGKQLPKEWNDLVADPTICNQLASETGGKVVTPKNYQDIFEHFGEKSRYVNQKSVTPLWNHWIILASLILVLSTEWIIRRANSFI